MLRRWKVTVQYDGTEYFGWQWQPDQPSVQEAIQDTLSSIYTEQCIIDGSGRTDAGVHALGQVFSFQEPREIKLDEATFKKAMNALLPQAIRVFKAEIVDEGFHARFSAFGKTYVYLIDQSDRINPFSRNFSWNRRHDFDMDLTRRVLELFEGEHDFSAFTVNVHMLKGTAVRKVFKADIEEWQGYYVLSFTGSGFLYKMVRSLVGQVVECAAGLKTYEKAVELLKTGRRVKAAQVAPAKGLFLGKVYYSEEELREGLSTPALNLFRERFFN